MAGDSLSADRFDCGPDHVEWIDLAEKVLDSVGGCGPPECRSPVASRTTGDRYGTPDGDRTVLLREHGGVYLVHNDGPVTEPGDLPEKLRGAARRFVRGEIRRRIPEESFACELGGWTLYDLTDLDDRWDDTGEEIDRVIGRRIADQASTRT